MDFSRFSVNIFVTELIFFVASFIVAIISALEINKIIAAKAVIANLTAGFPQDTALILPSDLINTQGLYTPQLITTNQFVISFLFATAFFVLMIKTKYGTMIFRSLFVLALFAGAEIVLRIWFIQELAIILAILLTAIRYVFPRVIIHNLTMIVAIIGIAINFGMNIDPDTAILILVIISVYDLLAVYITGHMVKMLKSGISSGIIFAMIVPQNFNDFMKTVSEIGKNKEKEFLDGPSKETEKTFDFVYLGGGDLAFPLIMVIAALKIGLYSAVITAIGALIGLFVLNIIFSMQKERKPMAALPPLAMFSVIGFLASLIKF